MSEFETDELKRAYDLLDVPYSAPPELIKHSYRSITKRWHPDRYRSGTPAHAEATQMMKSINEAYSRIEDAPLRRRSEGTAAPARRRDSEETGPEADLSSESFWEMVFDDWILRRVVTLPIAMVLGAVFAFAPPLPWLDHLIAHISFAWVLGVGAALLICCLFLVEFKKYRRDWRVWGVLVAFMILHFSIAVPALSKLSDFVVALQLRRSGPLFLADFAVIVTELVLLVYVTRLLTRTLAKSDIESR